MNFTNKKANICFFIIFTITLVVLSACGKPLTELSIVKIETGCNRSSLDKIDYFKLTVSALDVDTVSRTFSDESITLTIKSGKNRLFRLEALDKSGELLYVGETTLNLEPGSEVSVSIEMKEVIVNEPILVTETEIPGLGFPMAGEKPISEITGSEQYSGSINWKVGSEDFTGEVFELGIVYTAIITLMPKTGYTFEGIAENAFSVSGATSVTNSANSGLVTVVFKEPIYLVTDTNISELTLPIAGEKPIKEITGSEQYSGSINWKVGSEDFTGEVFELGIVYTAIITLTPKTGYTFEGIAENAFSVSGATSVTNSANSGLVTVVFEKSAAFLISIKYDGNGNNYGEVPEQDPVKPGAELVLAERDLTNGVLLKDGYIFRGWNTKADGSGTDYEPGDTLIAETSLNLYAKWLAASSIEDFQINESVIEKNNKNVENIVVPEHKDGKLLTTIGIGAFDNNNLIVSVILPDSITTIGERAFQSCSALKSITIPEGVTSIGNSAFLSCVALEPITLPDSITSIGESAFRSCSALTSITIPEGVTSIGNSAFLSCDALESITLPESLTEIETAAFSNCSALKSITIPSGVETIGKLTFKSCGALESITLSKSLTEIGDYTFQSCSALKSIMIPEGVITIGLNAFSSCDALESITLPESITRIGESAFSSCDALTSVTINATTPPSVNSNIFTYCENLKKIAVPSGSVEAYKEAEGWKEFDQIIVSQ